ncbi:ATP-binding cassette domain-containing protein [Shewanella sp. SM74]|uniref:ATP-binding cassette domain-containing protein n=1 Tax=Shewanella sp. SM74 TaxID=2912807 RepID=UPI0021D955D8|nr:ABC transporter ATP-binding protein [Shewanella sp. SM74]MCU8014239.1 energy-coupling factor ABC transporter ATP-binding protein [Shewanella sp. SM74]
MKLLDLEGVSFNYGSQLPTVLQEVNLAIGTGQCHCVSGPTGSGKSSLLNLLAGVLNRPHEGDIWRYPQLVTGLVMQDPQTQLLRQTVGAEVAFALENLGIPAEQMLPKVQLALRRVGLYLRLDTQVSTLSLGQKYRLMIAAQLVSEPHLLLLDEPWAQLDDHGVSELLVVLRNLIQDGMALVLVEHNASAFAEIIQHYWQLEAGKLSEGIYTVSDAPQIEAPAWRNQAKFEHLGKVLVSAEAFDFGFDACPTLFACPQGFQLQAGEIVTLVGDNGSGKTSLLKTIAGVHSLRQRLPLKVLGRRPKLGIYGAELGLLMQRPSRQLFESNVLAEMQFSLRRFELPKERAVQMLDELDLFSLAHLSPHKLSYGQQHLIALASLACLRPKVLLLDDPLAGMDKHYYGKVWYLLKQLSSQGCAILLSTHRSIEHSAVSRQLSLRNGLLVEESTEMAERYVG